MQDRTKYDTNRLAAASAMFSDSMALGPGGGGSVFSQWKTGAAGGRQQESTSNKFAVLDSDRFVESFDNVLLRIKIKSILFFL